LVPPEKIELRVGDTRSIRLQGRGTAGYEWNYHVEGEHGVTEISQRSGQEVEEHDEDIAIIII
jgi:hypothetical protein